MRVLTAFLLLVACLQLCTSLPVHGNDKLKVVSPRFARIKDKAKAKGVVPQHKILYFQQGGPPSGVVADPLVPIRGQAMQWFTDDPQYGKFYWRNTAVATSIVFRTRAQINLLEIEADELMALWNNQAVLLANAITITVDPLNRFGNGWNNVARYDNAPNAQQNVASGAQVRCSGYDILRYTLGIMGGKAHVTCGRDNGNSFAEGTLGRQNLVGVPLDSHQKASFKVSRLSRTDFDSGFTNFICNNAVALGKEGYMGSWLDNVPNTPYGDHMHPEFLICDPQHKVECIGLREATRYGPTDVAWKALRQQNGPAEAIWMLQWPHQIGYSVGQANPEWSGNPKRV